MISKTLFERTVVLGACSPRQKAKMWASSFSILILFLTTSCGTQILSSRTFIVSFFTPVISWTALASICFSEFKSHFLNIWNSSEEMRDQKKVKKGWRGTLNVEDNAIASLALGLFLNGSFNMPSRQRVEILTAAAAFSKLPLRSCLMTARSSSRHHSSVKPDGRRGLLLYKKSPNPMRMSPRNRILSIMFSICLKFWSETRTTDPFLKRTIGGSIVSTGTTTPAFPGPSMRSCVPAARKFWRTIMVAGWMPTAARPVFLALP